MSQILAVPTVSVSPEGAGSCTFLELESDGSSEESVGIKTDLGWRNYRYIAKPNQGYQFSHFALVYTIDDFLGGHDVRSATYDAQVGGWVYDTDGSSCEEFYADGSAWWKEVYTWRTRPSPGYWNLWYSKWVSDLSMVAVFTRIRTNQLVYSPSQNGRLVYSASQGGALVYDG